MAYAGVRGILGVVRLEALVQRQAQLVSKVDPAVNYVLAVSTAQAAGSGSSAARRRGRVHPYALGVNEGTNACDTRRPGLAHASAPRHCLHLFARIAAGVVTSGQWFRHAERALTGRASYDGAEGRSVGQASPDPRLR